MTEKLSSDRFETAAKRRNQNESAREFKVFVKVQIRMSRRGNLKFLLRYKQSCTIGKARLIVHNLV